MVTFEPLTIDAVIEFDMGSGEEEEDGIDIQHPDEEEEEDFGDQIMDLGSISQDFFTSDSDSNLEPFEGMEFESEEAARISYNSYARRIGFSTRVSVYHRSRRDGAIICRQIVCSRQGFRHDRDRDDDNSSESQSKRQRAVSRVGCKAMIMVNKRDSGKWAVSKFVKEHNHELVPPDKVHSLRSHRHVSGPARSLVDTLQATGIGPSGVMSGFTTVDCRNYISGSKQKTLGTGGQHVLDYLRKMRAETPNFFFAIQGDSDHSTGNILWVDANSRMNYNYFGDTVTFDTTYMTNRYRVPFAPFTGLNHHGQPVLFGCAIILDESEASFVWLFETWLAVMSGTHPISITTDQDRVIRAAVSHVFPNTRHRFCRWSIFREAQEKLSAVYQSYSNFEAEFRKCVNMTETVDEFEMCWETLLQRFSLVENEWFQSMYLVREQWVPVYLRDTFFGDMSITRSSDSINSYFDGYINASTTIQILVKQYEKVIASRHAKEVKADYDTLNTVPVLKTPSPMEKQAASLFTRRMFMKFQEELVETLAITATKTEDSGTITTYRIAKFGEDHKAYSVRFHVFEMKANCSCQMFEFTGIVCRHVLAVFKVTNVLTLPSQYVLKRWTRNAKSGVAVNERAVELPNNSRESLTVRFNNLRQEAIKFVEEGAKSSHTYNVAIEALQEAAKKVAAAKGPGIGVGSLVNGSHQEVNASEGNQSGQSQSFTVDEQDKKILELMSELDTVNQRCEVYRGNLLGVLKDMEEQKLKLSVKVQNVRLNLKD